MAEADAACEKWASRGGTFRYKWERKTDIDFTIQDGWERKIEKRISTESVRDCRHEEETNQFLGYEYPYKKGSLIEGNPWGDEKVVKHFRY